MTEELIAGIDEAGRGAVIGPLIIAGVSMDPDKENLLRKAGVRDSKLVTQNRRVKLAKLIEKHAKDVIVINVDACRIDTYRQQGINLNQIEAMKFVDALDYLEAKKAYVDSPDVKPDRLKQLLDKLTRGNTDLVVEHKADHKYTVCAAASIIAKVAREEEIDKLKKKYGDFGPGYSSNDKTIAWMRDWLSRNKEYPDIVRRTWITSDTIKAEKDQKKLSSWLCKKKD
ncbi:MAG: ribonuclease HII [Candidatus Aenigmatarchaeota archaeon]